MSIRHQVLVIAGALALINGIYAGDLNGKKVLFIDSYNEGYPWSDGVTRGIKKVLSPSGATLEIVRMDTKMKPSEAEKKEAASKTVSKIAEFKPDVVIAADDNASKYVIAPNYKNGTMPVVFCGINWDASGYGFPCDNITGMIEVSPAKQLIVTLEKYAKGKRIGYLSSDNETERKEVENINKKFGLNVQPIYATTFSDWKQQFTKFQETVDILIIGIYEGITDWDNAAALAHINTETRIPTGGMYDFNAELALLSFTKSPDEQGEYAATVATEILKGKSAKSFSVTENKKSDIIANMKIAKKLDIILDVNLLKGAKIIK